MSYDIIATPRFKRELKRLVKKFQSLKDEYASLVQQLETNPAYGTPIGNGCYKILVSIRSKGRGKSGGARVITFVVIVETAVYLLDIFDKSEKDNITDKDLVELLKGIK